MNRYQKFALERMLAVYDFVAANPGCSVKQLCEVIQIQSSTMRENLQKLKDSGHVECRPGVRSRSGQLPSAWTITDKARPDAPPPSKKRGKKTKLPQIIQPAKVEDAKRIITRARQIGVMRDPMIEALFGPARAVA